MAIVCQRHGLLYFPAPKNACSSLKSTFWEINTGNRFAPFEHEGRRIQNIHQIYPSKRFDMSNLVETVPDWRAYFRFAIVRDPVKRLVSAYRNRVRYHLELRAEIIEASGIGSPNLTPQPDFQNFVKHLDLYRQASPSIAHHTDLQKVYFGDNLDFFDAIYPMERLGDLERDLSRRIGREIQLPVLQNLGPNSDEIVFDGETRAAIQGFYREDYELLRDFYG